MTALNFYTFRGKFSGKLYYATGFNPSQAAQEVGIALKHLIIESCELVPPTEHQLVQDPTISRNTARYTRPL